MKADVKRPPLYTVWEEFCSWTLDTTAKIPKSQRFSFGQRIDAHTLDMLERRQNDGSGIRFEFSVYAVLVAPVAV